MDIQNDASRHHNPKATGIGFLLWAIAVVGFAFRGFGVGGRWSMGLGVTRLLGVALVLLAISRAYTTALQGRIMKLEMRVRTAALLTPQQQVVFSRLSEPQVVALHFVPDAELPALVERAGRENMTADEIRRAIASDSSATG